MSIFAPRAEKRVVTSWGDVGWGDAWGGTTKAGVRVSSNTALGLSTAWSCGVLLADSIMQLPVDVYRRRGVERVPVTRPVPFIFDPSLVGFTAREWRFQAVISLAFWGNAYARVTSRDETRRPTSSEILDPSRVTIEPRDYDDRPQYRIDGVLVKNPDDIIHMRRFARPGTVKGMSPLDLQRETLAVAVAAREFAAQWFAGGAHPSTVLSNPNTIKLDDEQAGVLRGRYMDAVRRRLGPAILTGGWKLETVQATPDVSGMHATEDRIDLAVCRAMRVPASMVDVNVSGQSITYQNRDHRNADYLTWSLNPWLVTFEDMWDRTCLVGGEFAKFNTAALLRSDTATRYKIYGEAIRMGKNNVNEVRAFEDEPPIEGGDEYLWPPSRGFPIESDQEE